MTNTPTDPTPIKRAWWKDALERITWTSVLGIIATLITVLGDFSDKVVWIPTLLIVLTTLKTLVAKKVGNPKTAAIGGNG